MRRSRSHRSRAPCRRDRAASSACNVPPSPFRPPCGTSPACTLVSRSLKAHHAGEGGGGVTKLTIWFLAWLVRRRVQSWLVA